MFPSHPAATDATPKPADHALIAAAAAVRQARTPTARAAATLVRPAGEPNPAPSLVDVMRTRRSPAPGGSFHPRVATMLKRDLTVRF